MCEGEKTREERDAELLARRCRSRRVRQCRGRGRLGKFKLKGIVWWENSVVCASVRIQSKTAVAKVAVKACTRGGGRYGKSREARFASL